MSFNNLDLDPRIENLIYTKLELENPTPIQMRAIPKIINGSNIIGLAPTGSGKTFAYLFPIFHWALKAKIKHNDPSVLILVPTRELVKQLEDILKETAKLIELYYVGIATGKNMNKVKKILQGMIDIVVATPGRLIIALEEGDLKLNNLSILVIDEIDRLLDMGFQAEIDHILEFLPKRDKYQTLMFGATLPRNAEQLARTIQSNVKIVDVGRSIMPKGITHEVYEVDEGKKFDTLVNILKLPDMDTVLIFTSSQHSARITSRNLESKGLELEEIHGGLTQRQRNIAIQNFRNRDVNVLVSTDLSARGIDIDDISHIISFEVPRVFEDYLHRAGRTARADKEGKSILLVSQDEVHNLRAIEKQLGYTIIRKQKFEKKVKKPSKAYPKQTGKRGRSKTRKRERRRS